MNETKPMLELWQELPPNLQQEVRDFAEFLLEKHAKSTQSLQLKWAGALREEKGVTAADLQREVLENWSD
ncbi:DUF2281 domain-containing protein [Ancylothrix sp. C2]|jgi:hypothetical protein|uniref:DUF2281 domain-containing protein n=1 Tax=Ancylothrix sp. D3o TaxID=2953691 RepID=UPI0021BAF820|nr:DUF2281 domain-containing protein [Ancylothrix sp. D3o]MCT7951613.1 DUF2281 domain-containing protein [Ancylothrix sp. D3o]